MKNYIKKYQWVIICLFIFSVYASNSYYQASIINKKDNKIESLIRQVNTPSKLESMKIRIENLRIERIKIQEQIDSKIEYKKSLVDETNIIKEELYDELDLQFFRNQK